ncbi:MAG TPA: hypothetical protein VF530_21530 [Planctomycetota bacterium]
MRVRVPNLILVGGSVALVMLGLTTYAGLLTSAWGSLLACAPAILATIVLVGGMLCGMFFFDVEEPDEPRAGRHGPGGSHLIDVVHRASIELHVRGLNH